MSGVAPAVGDLQASFEQHIRPVVFPHGPSAAEPELLFATGQAGVNAARAFGGLIDGREIAALSPGDLRAFHPRYLELSRSRSPEASRVLTESTSGWMRSALQHARTSQRSLLLDGTGSSPDIALATTGLFAGSGFTTTVVVVTSPRSESLLATASGYLFHTRAGRAAQFTTVAEHDASVESIRALIQILESAPSVDRLTIIGRDGATRFDAARTDATEFGGARAALNREQAIPLSAPRAMRWLSELRAMTDYALSSRQIARPLAEVLIELHEIGLREILPNLPLPRDSQARPAAEANLGRQFVAIRQAIRTDQRPERQPAPVISSPEPDRGISI
ncbi:zeta toxin family protein [Microbacterium sp.]|uniref:zeta toxin family protein n=1 Tax=Microbacterium sp. TaxID=51671 RepID=UPI003C1DC9AE